MTTLDRPLIARFVERQMRRDRNLGSWPALEKASGVSRSTLHRLRNHDPRVVVSTFARLEPALGLPDDTILLVGVHDLDGLAEVGANPDVIDWVGKELAKKSPRPLPNEVKAV